MILALVAVIAVTVLGKFGKIMDKQATKIDTTVSNSVDNAGKAYCESLGNGYSWDNEKGVCKSN